MICKIDWWALFPNFLQCVKPSKYRIFQCRILLKTIVTNVRSKLDREVNANFFVRRKVRQLSISFVNVLTLKNSDLLFVNNKGTKHGDNVDTELIILNNYIGPAKQLVNAFIIVMKYYIYSGKCQEREVNFMDYMVKVSEYYHYEKSISESTSKDRQFEKRWKNVF